MIPTNCSGFELDKKAKKTKRYEDIKKGDQVRVPVINKIQRGYIDQWTYELKPVEKDLQN